MNVKSGRVAQMDEWKEWKERKPGIVAGVDDLKSGRKGLMEGVEKWMNRRVEEVDE
jgi:hypothetical protein